MRAMAVGFRSAPNEAGMRFAFTFGDFLNLAVLIVGCWWPVRWHGGFAGFDDRTRFIAPTDLGGNGLMQPMKFGVVEVPE